MSAALDAFVFWGFIIALTLVIGAPLVVAAYQWFTRKRRRRLERSKRPIKIKREEESAAQAPKPACPHRRSRSKAREGPNGVMFSVCKWCGQAMRRNAPDDWEAIPAPETKT